ncbi:MAG: hypothetical protein HOD92_25525 [Deltaproteobacteria bacterium]|nr:hypothetical protein [Deltaproteobacteria bacterium]MBT4525420.1 hypothetical protein [Deltaproteobacteria bacterium]
MKKKTKKKTTMKDPIERKRVISLNITLVSMFIILPLGGYFFNGLDFAKATLLGCLVVAINFFVSQRLLSRVITEGKIPKIALFIYMAKLGVSGLIIYLAIDNDFDAWGLMIGLSSIFIAIMISSLFRGQSSQVDGEKV